MKLISMTDFVLEQLINNNYSMAVRYEHCHNYANFLKRKLELGMFVPCDLKGTPLEKPKNFIHWRKGMVVTHDLGTTVWYGECEQYQEAKERVLFEGWYLKNLLDNYYELTTNDGFLNCGSVEEIKYKLKDSTIENIIPNNLTLTENAIKQLR